METFKQFLRKKDIEFSLKRYGVDALGKMALGLFSSLIVGLILREVGNKAGIEVLSTVGTKAMSMTGAAIGVSVAMALKAPLLVVFSSVATGFIGNELGGPAGAFLAAAIGAEFGKAISNETKVDIIVTPITTILFGATVGTLIGPLINNFMIAAGNVIMWATELLPLPMGILVSVIMGLILTLPISSAALAIMLNLGGIAAGAACAGCCAQMIGFAVSSYRENKVSGLISQGLGTSMLQIPNIVKNPLIWIPPTAASAVVGAVSAAAFKMENISSGAGMGTSGLVGQFGAFAAMGYSPNVFVKVLIVHFVLPAIISLLVSEFMRKKNLIKFGDMRLNQ